MKGRMHIWGSFLFFFLVCGVTAQELTQSYLEGLRDEELLDLYDTVDEDSIKAEKVARAYLDRARREKDTIKMARGYDRLARIFHPEKNIAFADSIIELTSDINHITYPGQGYLFKGYYYLGIDNEQALDNFYKGYSNSKDKGNISQELYSLYFLIDLQMWWGDSDIALNYLKKRHELIISPEFRDNLLKTIRKGRKNEIETHVIDNELVSYFAFVNYYIHIRDLKNARLMLQEYKKRLDIYDGYNKKRYESIYINCLLEINYYDENYDETIKNANELIDISLSRDNPGSLFDAYSYLGFLNIDKEGFEDGIHYLELSDSIYDKNEINVLPYRRRVFQELLKFYKDKSNANKQIEYLTKLIDFDSIMKGQFLKVGPRHIREFETPKLLEEKQELIDSLEEKEQRNQRLLWGGGIALLVAVGFLGYYYRRQRLFQKRFEALIQPENPKNPIAKAGKSAKEPLDIDPEIVAHILSGLQQFENNKGFVDSKISLNNLAKQLDTNSNYLSRVINGKKGKGFSQYLSDLRLEYCITELLSQELYRKFTIKAIAEECGFKNTESFSRGFYKKYGIYPSYYIKELEKKKV